MTARRRTNLTKLRVFYPFKNDTRLDFLENLHCLMNLMVGIFLMSEVCGNVIGKSWRLRVLRRHVMRKGLESIEERGGG
jgi:hypothetical protein